MQSEFERGYSQRNVTHPAITGLDAAQTDELAAILGTPLAIDAPPFLVDADAIRVGGNAVTCIDGVLAV